MVFTNEKCVGCNKCIRSCPVLTANVAEDEKINVNEDMCIQCGACFDNCRHGARDFDDDTKAFLQDLKAGKKFLHYFVFCETIYKEKTGIFSSNNGIFAYQIKTFVYTQSLF